MNATSGFIITGPTETLIAAMFPPKYDKHVQDWRWHLYSLERLGPNYLADIAARQAAKRAAGIGPEGLCHG